MILISHRGNTEGSNQPLENNPAYVDLAIEKGFDVEVDAWYIDTEIYLGHDKPQYRVDLEWLQSRTFKLWIHCKNVEAVIFFRESAHMYNFFWHENDTLALTSNKHIWAYPGKQPIENSIAVMPEINNDNISQCLGICSDYIENYR